MMKLKAYLYSKCSTCQNAKKWLEAKKIPFEIIDITLHPPSVSELKKLLKQSGLSIKKFLNTSGEQYRALNLKDKLDDMSEDELIKLLSGNGRLLKRPIVTDHTRTTVGFNATTFQEVWG